MADKWEYRTVEAGTFKLDRLLAQGWEAYTVTEQEPSDGTPRGLGSSSPAVTVVHLRRMLKRTQD